MYDAHYGWQDPTRRQLAERAQLAGVSVDPLIELAHVEAALGLVAAGVGDTIAGRAVVAGASFPAGLRAVPFADPLYDTIALVKRPRASAVRGRPRAGHRRDARVRPRYRGGRGRRRVTGP
ncbi:LysR substrate-binding domain-containing protein [Streptomyces parvulus]|uniref:LysR substrate-binding domain-containing protein n=1 Tax=Streptomyces parvulus TaxID=146923 RepID=UPI0034530392